MGAAVPKQLLTVGGESILRRSVRLFTEHARVNPGRGLKSRAAMNDAMADGKKFVDVAEHAGAEIPPTAPGKGVIARMVRPGGGGSDPEVPIEVRRAGRTRALVHERLAAHTSSEARTI